MLPSHNSWRTAKVNGPALNLFFISSIVGSPLLAVGKSLEDFRDVRLRLLQPEDGPQRPCSMVHTAGRPRTSPETRRSTQRPSDELPTSLPCSTMTLPRRIVIIG